MDLLALADFNLVARHGGFGRAARAAARPKATLSRRVADLETGLGLRLVERSVRALRLTDEGRALFERTDPLLAEIDDVTTEIASGSGAPRGRLRISAPFLFTQIAVGKIAAGFALRHPQIRLEVTSEDRAVDLVEEGYDLAIRVNPAPDDALVGRPFLRDRLVVVARPDIGRPAGDRAVPAVARMKEEGLTAWTVRTPTGSSPVAVEPVLRLSSLVAIRDAVLAGAGIGCLPVSLVGRDLDRGALVSWGELDGPAITLWALYPSRRLLGARVSAFLAFLHEAFPTGAPEELAAFVNR